jgi:ferredoxin
MSVEIKFEVENQPERSGIVAEGSYLWDAAKRLGVHLQAECEGRGECETCTVMVKEGAECLSAPTTAEVKMLGDERHAGGERLSCQARIERNGELLVMVRETVTEEAKLKEEKPRDFRKDFEDLPLEKKFKTLVEIETVAFGEAINFVAGLPSTVVGKVMDLLGVLGLKMEEQKRAAQRPVEHQTNGTEKTAGSEDKADGENSKTL